MEEAGGDQRGAVMRGTPPDAAGREGGGRGRVPGDVDASQKADSPLEPPGRNPACQHLDFSAVRPTLDV